MSNHKKATSPYEPRRLNYVMAPLGKKRSLYEPVGLVRILSKRRIGD
jgi:hypothetical protein